MYDLGAILLTTFPSILRSLIHTLSPGCNSGNSATMYCVPNTSVIPHLHVQILTILIIEHHAHAHPNNSSAITTTILPSCSTFHYTSQCYRTAYMAPSKFRENAAIPVVRLTEVQQRYVLSSQLMTQQLYIRWL